MRSLIPFCGVPSTSVFSTRGTQDFYWCVRVSTSNCLFIVFSINFFSEKSFLCPFILDEKEIIIIMYSWLVPFIRLSSRRNQFPSVVPYWGNVTWRNETESRSLVLSFSERKREGERRKINYLYILRRYSVREDPLSSLIISIPRVGVPEM